MKMHHRLLKPLAFIMRDFLIAISYRMNFFLQILGIFVSTLLFFFLSKLIGDGVGSSMKPYGNNYFGFVLIGIAVTDYLSLSINSFAREIRNAQLLGTLEALLVTPTAVSTILFSSSLYNFAFTSFRIVLYLVYGVFFFGLKLHITSLTSFIIIMSLTVLAFTGIGMISAAFIIAFKQGSPLTWLVSITSGVLGGVLYPVSVLPSWLRPYASLLPITHAL